MATASVTFPAFSAPNLADPNQLNQNFDDLVDFLNNSVLHRDASKTLLGNLDAGGFKVTNVGSPTVSTDVATKGTVDAHFLSIYPGPRATTTFPSSTQQITAGPTSVTDATVTFTATTGRRYRLVVDGYLRINATNTQYALELMDGATVLRKTVTSRRTNGDMNLMHFEYISDLTVSGSKTWTLRATRLAGSSYIEFNGDTAQNRCIMYVEDIGST